MTMNIYKDVNLKQKSNSKTFDTRFKKQHIQEILKELKNNSEIKTNLNTLLNTLKLQYRNTTTTNRIIFELKNYIHINNAFIEYKEKHNKRELKALLEKYNLKESDFFNKELNINVEQKKVTIDNKTINIIHIYRDNNFKYNHRSNKSFNKCLCSVFSDKYANQE